MSTKVKICGISDQTSLDTCIRYGATFVGFVFYPPSPRAVTAVHAAQLLTHIPAPLTTVGLFVDPDDALLDETLRQAPLGMIQLHGKEPPQRVAEIRSRFGKPVMKAIPISAAADLAQATAYEPVADWLLFDAKPPKDGLPGGNALSFDWNLLRGRQFGKPWMLAGGLNAHNLAEAIQQSGASCVDISSGVEDDIGHKSPELIKEFLHIAHQL